MLVMNRLITSVRARGWGGCSDSGGQCQQFRSWRQSGPGRCGGAECTAADLLPPPTEPSEQPCPCCGHWELLPCVCELQNGQSRGRRGRRWVVESGSFVVGRGDNGACPGPTGYEDDGWRQDCELLGPCCPQGQEHPVQGPERLGMGVQCCVDTELNPIAEFATADYRLPPCPRDCVGVWSCWSSCSASCGGGLQTRVYSHVQSADHGGEQCPHPDGYVQERCCNEQDCVECGLAACALDADARPNPEFAWPQSCCCWSAWVWTFVALLPLGLGFSRPAESVQRAGALGIQTVAAAATCVCARTGCRGRWGGAARGRGVHHVDHLLNRPDWSETCNRGDVFGIFGGHRA